MQRKTLLEGAAALGASLVSCPTGDVVGQHDPDHNIRLVVDEYGTWYEPGSEVDASRSLGQQISLRDALLTAQTLDIFHRHAENMGIGACAQLINCLNSLFLPHEDRFVVIPIFFCFLFSACTSSTGEQPPSRAEISAPHINSRGTISRRMFGALTALPLSKTGL